MSSRYRPTIHFLPAGYPDKGHLAVVLYQKVNSRPLPRDTLGTGFGGGASRTDHQFTDVTTSRVKRGGRLSLLDYFRQDSTSSTGLEKVRREYGVC